MICKNGSLARDKGQRHCDASFSDHDKETSSFHGPAAILRNHSRAWYTLSARLLLVLLFPGHCMPWSVDTNSNSCETDDPIMRATLAAQLLRAFCCAWASPDLCCVEQMLSSNSRGDESCSEDISTSHSSLPESPRCASRPLRKFDETGCTTDRNVDAMVKTLAAHISAMVSGASMFSADVNKDSECSLLLHSQYLCMHLHCANYVKNGQCQNQLSDMH